MKAAWFTVRQLPALLRGGPFAIRPWIEGVTVSQSIIFLTVIILGTGAFGAAIGFWRAPLQAVYAGIKLPLVILLTTCGNALLNGTLAPLLGLNVGFRQSFQMIVMSFVIASAILGSFSPIILFMVWNMPSISADAEKVRSAYQFMQLALAGVIAFAGIMANWRLFPLLQERARSNAIAGRVLFSWLAGNLFLGSQICWILRPFVGSPGAPLKFIGSGLHEGNFFESIFNAIKHLLFS